MHAFGALAWNDSPNHRRFGCRDASGEIVEAWGVNLAPVAALLPKLRRLAEDLDVDRAHWRYLRHRIAARRAAIEAAADTGLRDGFLEPHEARAWRRLAAEAAGDASATAPLSALQRRLRELDHLDAVLLTELAGVPEIDDPEAVENPPFSNELSATEPEDGCHGTHDRMPPLDNTTNPLVRETTTVAGAEEGVAAPPRDLPTLAGDPTTHGVRMRDLLEILPSVIRLRIASPNFGWAELVDAAYCAATEMDVSDHAWGQACGELGREGAAIAVAVIAAKNELGLIRSPGGYLVGMTRRNATGELRLRNSVFGLLHEKHKAASGSGEPRRGRAH